MTALGGHQREAFLQVKTHLMAEYGDRASAGAVIFGVPSVSTFCIKSRYCFMVPQEFCCCGRWR